MSKEFLRRLPLFAGLKESDLDQFNALAVPTGVKAGQVVMEEGTMADSLYVILDGEFEVVKRSGNQEVLLGIRKAGDAIGEMAVLEQAPRIATVRALKDGKVLVISEKAFYQVLACSPSAV